MDRRIEKTRRAIQTAYLALRQRQAANTITVAAVAELADIGRGTFYLHYSDLAALDAAITDQVAANIVAQLQPDRVQVIGGSYRHWLSALLALLEEARPRLALAAASGQLDRLIEPCRAALVDLFDQLAPGPLDPLAARYCAAGLVGVTVDWLTGALTSPEAALVAMMDREIRALLA
ncbi:TetR/AcrR family transcriptional regulator [Lacticaseibacillus absianus]|uniref:TetR/AcrR family transcriptional regulator n=1 Tax=Lacticaseibacillus absianus TaxID=2729623 RepID=UPI0015C92483|nr:TetR/AcrR family transcriptional regulator [Lacticaseibacillus absianus]